MDQLKSLMCLLIFPCFLLSEEPLLNTKTSEYLGNIKVLLLALPTSFFKLFKNYLPSSASIDQKMVCFGVPHPPDLSQDLLGPSSC